MSLYIILNIIYAACFLPCLIFLWLTMKNESRPKNNLILSTTIPKEHWEDERVTAIQKDYRKNLNIACFLLFLLYLPVLLFEYMSIQFTYLMFWLVVMVFAPNIPYALAVKKLRALKKELWYNPAVQKVQVADTTASSVFEEKQLSVKKVHCIVPLIISLLPLTFPSLDPVEFPARPIYLLTAINTVVILMLWLCARFAFRKKSDQVNSDTTLTMTLTRIRRHYWNRFWRYSIWLTAFANLFSTMYSGRTNVYLIIMTVYALLITVLALFMEFKIRFIQQQLNVDYPSEILVDEDEHWIWGIFYYNKNDKNMMVNARIGMGSTMNMAHPAGAGLYIFAIILLLGCTIPGFVMIRGEFTPPNIVLTEDSLEAYHTKREYAVTLSDITSVELITELPATYKTFGTNYPHLYKGGFSVATVSSNANLCLDPYDALFLVVRTDRHCYIFSMEDSSELKEIYKTLR